MKMVLKAVVGVVMALGFGLGVATQAAAGDSWSVSVHGGHGYGVQYHSGHRAPYYGFATGVYQPPRYGHGARYGRPGYGARHGQHRSPWCGTHRQYHAHSSYRNVYNDDRYYYGDDRYERGYAHGYSDGYRSGSYRRDRYYD